MSGPPPKDPKLRQRTNHVSTSAVLHIAPESAVGGPLALVKTGDRITLDVPNRKIELLVPAKELAARKKLWKAPPPHPGSDRGYTGLFHRTVLQADEGVDFDFLGPAKG